MLVVFFLVILLSSSGQLTFEELRVICADDPEFWECYKLPVTPAVINTTEPTAEPIVSHNKTATKTKEIPARPNLVARIATTFR